MSGSRRRPHGHRPLSVRVERPRLQTTLGPARPDVTRTPDAARDLGITTHARERYQARRRDVHGWVYFIVECVEDGYIKIGHAVDPLRRLAHLQVGAARPLVIRQLLEGGRDLEKELHAEWADAAVGGEWFGDGWQGLILDHADRLASAQRDGSGEFESLRRSMRRAVSI